MSSGGSRRGGDATAERPAILARFFGRLRNLDEAGRQRHAATRAERDAMALAVAAETARGCIGRLSLDARLDVTREMVRSRAESLRIAEDQARVGYTSQLQRTQAPAEYEVVAQAVRALELAVRQQENALHILMGDLPGDLPRVNLAELTPPTVPGTLSSTLLRHRLDLAVAELSLAATDATLAARRAEFLPNVSLSWVLAGLFVNALDYDPVTIWNVGASVLAPIFSGGRLTAQVDVALARRDQAGHASYLEELDAQRNLSSAQREAIVLRERQLANLVTLYEVLGGGWTGVRTRRRADEAARRAMRVYHAVDVRPGRPSLRQMIRTVLHRVRPASRSRAPCPPGPAPRYPGQFLVSLANDKLGLFSSMARHGDVTEIQLGPRHLVLLTHPDDIRRMLVTEQRKFRKGRALDRTRPLLGNGLLTNEGESHLRQRRLVQPAFHRQRIAMYATTMTGLAADVRSRWNDGAVVDIHGEMLRLTLAIAGRTMFDVDVERDARVVHEALDLSLRMFALTVLPFGFLLEHSPLRWVREMRLACGRMDEMIARLIAERRAVGADRGDLLAMLVAARDEGDGMSDAQLCDEIVTLLLAGHETTANALTWTWYLLSQNARVEARLHAELDAVLGGRLPTIADVGRLDYLRLVLAESMRLYPPAWAVERRVVEPFEVGGYVIAPGTTVLASQYLVHRDPRWWPAPSRFDPDRWLGEEQERRAKFAYFPFGGGTRICIGEPFAWTEGILVLATLAQRWRACYEAPHAPEPHPLVTLRPRGGLRMRVRRRAT